MMWSTVADPTAKATLAAACKTRGHVVELSAKKKHQHYDRYIDADRYVLVQCRQLLTQ